MTYHEQIFLTAGCVPGTVLDIGGEPRGYRNEWEVVSPLEEFQSDILSYLPSNIALVKFTAISMLLNPVAIAPSSCDPTIWHD